MARYLARVLLGALALGFVVCSRTVVAQDTEVVVIEKKGNSASEAYGLAYARRGLVMPKGMVRGTFDVTLGKLFSDSTVPSTMNFGAAITVVENLEIGFSRYRMGSFPDLNMFPSLGFGGEGLIAFLMSPSSSLGDIPFYARYRVVDGDVVELAIDFGVLFPTETTWGILAAVPIRFHAGDEVAVDTGAQLWVNDAGTTNLMSFGIPLSVVGNLTKNGFVKVDTGVVILDLSRELLGKPVYSIPLGFGGGYTLEAGSTMLDLFAGFRWPALGSFFDGASESTTDYWTLTFGLNIYSPVLF